MSLRRVVDGHGLRRMFTPPSLVTSARADARHADVSTFRMGCCSGMPISDDFILFTLRAIIVEALLEMLGLRLIGLHYHEAIPPMPRASACRLTLGHICKRGFQPISVPPASPHGHESITPPVIVIVATGNNTRELPPPLEYSVAIGRYTLTFRCQHLSSML